MVFITTSEFSVSFSKTTGLVVVETLVCKIPALVVVAAISPIVTPPSGWIRSLAVKLLADDVKNAKCASSLFVVSDPAIPLIWATNLLFHCQFIFARVCPALDLLTLKFICLPASFGVLKPICISPPIVNFWPGLD